MPRFSFSKVDKYRDSHSRVKEDLIDIKFPAELRAEANNKELLLFIVDDDPIFLQILNTHFSKLILDADDGSKYQFKIRNFATGNSCIKDLGLNPDLVLLNYFIGQGITNALGGKETLKEIQNINPNQKVLILNDLEHDLRGAFIEHGLRDYIIQDETALEELNRSVTDILNRNF